MRGDDAAAVLHKVLGTMILRSETVTQREGAVPGASQPRTGTVSVEQKMIAGGCDRQLSGLTLTGPPSSYRCRQRVV
jgi:hypothetical protein